MKRLVDYREREQIRQALGETLVVEAAAGTGKTTELVGRIIEVVSRGHTTIDHIVAITFTEKAAGELKLRVRTGLEEAREKAKGNKKQLAHLETALAHLEEAWMGTIHAFCADMLRERPVEAGVDPDFEPLSEGEAQELYARAFDSWCQGQLDAPPEGVRRSLRRSAIDGSPVDRLRSAGWTLANWRDFATPWRRPDFGRTGEIDKLVELVHAFADLTEGPRYPDYYFRRDTAAARDLSSNLRTLESARRRDYDLLEAGLVDLAQDRDFNKAKLPRRDSNTARESVERAHSELLAALGGFAERADADLAALLQSELQEPIAAYEDLKKQTGRLDFVDLLLLARNMVRDDKQVRRHFQERFSHLFVDEFQDTDPLQAEIILLLSSQDPDVDSWTDVRTKKGKLFIVGDPKQSIYRFRRADVGIYERVKKQLVDRGARLLRLTTSFRSVRAIQDCINEAFSPFMTGDEKTLQANYVPLSPYRKANAEQPAIVALPVPEPYGKTGIAQYAINSSLPDAVGGFVDWLIRRSGWTVTESRDPTKAVPVSAQHVCLLFRRFQFYGGDPTHPYVQALEARGIPHLVVGGKSFHEREEVGTLRSALTAIEWPDDELSVFATLRGAFFAVGDEALLIYRQHFGRLHPMRLPKGTIPSETEPVVQALQLLQKLHRSRNYIPVADSIHKLLEETPAHVAFALRPSGEQVLANVIHVAELARASERGGRISFRSFVEQLHRDADRGQAPEAPILEDGSEGVRLMTVHKAKGLEFPVVILADITAKLISTHADRHLEGDLSLCAVRISGWSPLDLREHETEEMARDTAENVRLAYVAASRARDLLVVPAVGDHWEGWTNSWIAPLYAAVYPESANRQGVKTAPLCPQFGQDSVKKRPEGVSQETDNVRPGLHAITRKGFNTSAKYNVVWWDPHVLPLGVRPLFALRQEKLLEKVDKEVVAKDLATFQNWEAQHRAAVATGAAPSLVVRTVTDRVGSFPELDGFSIPDVVIVDVGAGPTRPSSRRYGSLVHAILATVPLDDDKPGVVDRAAALQGKVLGALDEEVVSAQEIVERALRHEVMQRARACFLQGRCRRECPVTLHIDDILWEGVIDLAFEEESGWTVVDFKTDQELEANLKGYKEQVRLYAAAIAEATGQRVSPMLMRM